jgi:thiamine kinase-like enzyme
MSIIGQGISGIVYYPSLCEEYEGDYVSKLTTSVIAEKELQFATIIQTYIPEGAIYVEHVCKSPITKELKGLVYDTLALSKYGGVSIDTYMAKDLEYLYYYFEKYKHLVTPNKIREAEELLHALEELREQIMAMNARGFFHNDISQENIVYNETTKKAYLIDFERAGYEPNTKDEMINTIIDQLKKYILGIQSKMKGGRKTKRKFYQCN